MRFRYLGDKDDMTAFGYDFSNGNEPDVRDTAAIAKLSSNSHFECVEPFAMPTMKEGTGDMPAKKKGGRPRKEKP